MYWFCWYWWSGFYIATHWPCLSGKASEAYTMGWFKIPAFCNAYGFFFNFVFRIYRALWEINIPTGNSLFPPPKHSGKNWKRYWKWMILQMKGDKEKRTPEYWSQRALPVWPTLAPSLPSCSNVLPALDSMHPWLPMVVSKLFAWVPSFGRRYPYTTDPPLDHVVFILLQPSTCVWYFTMTT